MASLCRIYCRALLVPKWNTAASFVRIAPISTSKKDKDTSITTAPRLFQDDLPEKFDARVTNKHWVSWGFDIVDRETDATFVHIIFFIFVTLVMVTGGYYTAYVPPKNFRDWAQREAYMQIQRREAAGLPHVDRDLIPGDTIDLPTDEELGNTDIII